MDLLGGYVTTQSFERLSDVATCGKMKARLGGCMGGEWRVGVWVWVCMECVGVWVGVWVKEWGVHACNASRPCPCLCAAPCLLWSATRAGACQQPNPVAPLPHPPPGGAGAEDAAAEVDPGAGQQGALGAGRTL